MIRLVPLLLALLLGGGALRAQEAVVLPRVVVALYDSRLDQRWRDTTTHQMAEMPLNHLGLVVEPHDIRQGLPDVAGRSDVRGVLTWFRADQMPAPEAYVTWANGLLNAGKRLVVLGQFGFLADEAGRRTPQGPIDALLARLGLTDQQEWIQFTYSSRITSSDPALVGFERQLGPMLPPFPAIRANPPARALVTIERASPPLKADPVVLGPHGAYAATDYTHFFDVDLQRKQWVLEPFRFFALAFATDDLPKPDTTTLVGRRIYYSHVDGDGWRNQSQIEKYKKAGVRSIDVLRIEAIEAFPDLPVSVAPIAGDLDPDWCGDAAAQEAARAVFRLHHVEAATHTYSHPLDWGFFADGNAEKEAPFRKFYPGCGRSRLGLLGNRLNRLLGGDGDAPSELEGGGEGIHAGAYATPRSYARLPFDLDLEITGSASYLTRFLPVGKRIELMQWSGNTLPFAEAVTRTRAAGMAHLNGGDTRFDPEFASVGWVAPIGRRVGNEWQVYASASNENTYTALWTDRFFGFRYLARTIDNTGAPRRLKPVNIYYHVYSADRLASLNAVIENLRYVRRLDVVPIAASAFARIAAGFFTTRVVSLGDGSWLIGDRGALQTVRFDAARGLTVDFDRSLGVLGQRREESTLYVSLDPAVAEPVVALALGEPSRAHLVESRWPIHDLRVQPGGWRFAASGFGSGAMLWQDLPDRRFRVIQGATAIEAASDAQGLLAFDLGAPDLGPREVQVERLP